MSERAPDPLAAAQALLWQAMTWPTGVDDFLAQAPAHTQRQFDECFVAHGSLRATQRLSVYANAYFWRLHGVLEENHPVVAWLLGADRFRNLATDYVLAHPSTAPDLRTFSRHLPGFLLAVEASKGLDEGHRAALSAVAQIELHVGNFLHAPDEPALTAPELAALPAGAWPSLRLQPRKTVALVSAPVDYVAMDKARRLSTRADGPSGPTPSLDRFAGSHELVVWRRGHTVLRRDCQPAEAASLRALLAGGDFMHLCLAASRAHAAASPIPEPTPQGQMQALAAQASAWVHAWVEAGLLRGMQHAPP